MAAKREAEKDQTAEQKNEVQQTTENQTDADKAQNAETGKAENQPESNDSDADKAQNAETGKAENQPESNDSDADKAASEKEKAKTVKLTLRHKSHTPHYHRCGLTLTKTFAEYEVSEDCVEKIKGDKWIEVKDAK